MALIHHIFYAADVEEAQIAFALLAGENFEAAQGLAIALEYALPHTAPLWAAILEYANIHRKEAFDWGRGDSEDTANEVSRRMGWQDMERQQ